MEELLIEHLAQVHNGLSYQSLVTVMDTCKYGFKERLKGNNLFSKVRVQPFSVEVTISSQCHPTSEGGTSRQST